RRSGRAEWAMRLTHVRGVRTRGGPASRVPEHLSPAWRRTVRGRLANPASSGAGDGAVDTVVVNATTSNDVVRISAAGNSLSIDGLSTQISVAEAEPSDQLIVHGLASDVVVDASAVAAARWRGVGDELRRRWLARVASVL